MRRSCLLLALVLPLALASCGDDDKEPVNPADTTDPGSVILEPQNGAVVTAGNVAIQAQATDNRGVARVEFYVDGVMIGEDLHGTADLYGITWDASGLSPGSGHTIRARAIDTSDNDAEVTIAVQIFHSGITVHNQPIAADETWAPSGNIHVVTGSISVAQGATLTILPGCRVEFQEARNAGIVVGYGSSGALVAEGTPADPIVFTSQAAVPLRGDWRGLGFFDSTRATTHLSYCTIEFTGYNGAAAVYLAWEAVVRMDHCTVRMGAGPGIGYEHGGHVEQFTDNTITQCARYPLETEPQFVRHLGAGNHFSGNDEGFNAILLYGGVMKTSGTWRSHDVPYELAPVDAGGGIEVGNTEGSTAILTLEPGAVIRFSPGSQLAVGQGGAAGGLVALGTESDPITFTSTALNPAAGDWQQIALGDGADDGQCRLAHCVVEFGGSAGRGNLEIVDARPDVTGCIFRHGASYGIRLAGSEYPDPIALEAGNTFDDNAGENVFVAP